MFHWHKFQHSKKEKQVIIIEGDYNTNIKFQVIMKSKSTPKSTNPTILIKLKR